MVGACMKSNTVGRVCKFIIGHADHSLSVCHKPNVHLRGPWEYLENTIDAGSSKSFKKF